MTLACPIMFPQNVKTSWKKWNWSWYWKQTKWSTFPGAAYFLFNYLITQFGLLLKMGESGLWWGKAISANLYPSKPSWHYSGYTQSAGKGMPRLATATTFKLTSLWAWNTSLVYSIAWVIFPLFTTGYKPSFDNLQLPTIIAPSTKS